MPAPHVAVHVGPCGGGVAPPHRVVLGAIGVLLVLIFSKYFYIAGISTFYTFYLIDKFDLSVQIAQVHLFVFLSRPRSARWSAARWATASGASR